MIPVLSTFGMLAEEACLDAEGVFFPDLIDDAALPAADCPLIVVIVGAVSSTSQLHYAQSVTSSNPLIIQLTLKNSPNVEL